MNELLGNYSLAQIVSFLIIAFSIFVGIEKVLEYVLKHFTKAYNQKRSSEENLNMLKTHSQDIDSIKKYQTTLGAGIKEILKCQLKNEFARITKRGSYIYISELEDYLEAYEIYHSLGGNGSITKRKNILESMEVKDDDKMAD